MTIKEIAQLAGVSISTVSKIVNNKDENINPQTRSRVLQIVKEYNYTPYGAVKNASSSKKFLLGVLLRTLTGRNLLLDGILQTAQECGYGILLLDSLGSAETEAKHLTMLCRNNVDGIIWEPVSEDSTANVSSLTRQEIPFCLINGFSRYPSFHIDFAGIGYALTRELIGLKHTNVACLLPGGGDRSSQILEGFQKCLYDNHIPYSDRMLLSGADRDCVRKIIRHNITGIVGADDEVATLLYEQLKKFNYRIPADFSLAAPLEDAPPKGSAPVSGITIPYFEFGSHVCRQLINLCEKTAGAEAPGLFPCSCKFISKETIDNPPFFRKKRFVVVGSINMDITLNVDHLPQSGKTTYILSSALSTGGKGANQAVGIARLGHEVSLIGEIGNDSDATYIFDILCGAGVHTQEVHRNRKQETGKAYIYIENDGESAISILPGANGTLTPQKILERQHIFKDAGYCLISTEIPVEAAAQAAATAKKYGARTVLKPSTLKELSPGLIRNTDIFIPNRKEAAALSPEGCSVEEQADYFLESGFETVIITLGHAGCYLRTKSTSRHFSASDFMPIDTTGGADAFISALAAYLSEGCTLETSIQIAMYAAGFCISRQGVTSALTDRNTLESHLAQNAPELLVGR